VYYACNINAAKHMAEWLGPKRVYEIDRKTGESQQQERGKCQQVLHTNMY
jgi:hypothetical protein